MCQICSSPPARASSVRKSPSWETGDKVAVLVRGMQERGVEAGDDAVEGGQPGDRFGPRFTMPIVIPTTADGAGPIDIGPATPVRMIGYPVVIAQIDRTVR